MPSLLPRLTVSCIICFHREGLLAYTTLHSIVRARTLAEAEGISVQCVMTLDNHDELTGRSVMGHPLIREGDILDVVNYGDAGLSRNHAIKRSSGEYIIIVDGDDYSSDNFISVFTKYAACDSGSVFFPEYLFSFGMFNGYMKMGMPNDSPQNIYALFSENYYSSRLAAHRSVFLRIPFVACSSGFGYEDWHWACEAVAAGMRLRPATDVVLLYRRRCGSRVGTHVQGNIVIPPSKFFEMLPPPDECLPGAPSPPASALSMKALAKEAFFKLLQFLPQRVSALVFSRLKAALAGSRSVIYPPIIEKALLEVAAVDGMLHPRMLPPASMNVPQYDLLPGKVYAALWHELRTHAFDVVYLVGHIGVGGGDLMAINYMASTQGTGKRVLCILMESAQSDRERIPVGVTVLHFGRAAACLAHQQKQRVLARLLVQLRPSVIHAVNEWVSFEMMGTFGAALKSKSRLYASIFADAQDERDIHFGAGTQYLRGLMAHCSTIITDNMVTVEEWHGRLGLPLNFFQAVYGIATPLESLHPVESRGKRVLWAGRLDKEKRLDILLSIARVLPGVNFDVYGQAVLDEDSVLRDLKRQPNVTLCGGYRNFYEIPLQQYALFLYTTQNDGLPNVLLEAAACGLPLIAPDRGGISDFVSNETGWLLASHTDVEAYVNAIRAVLANPDEADRRVCRAQQLLASRHSREKFAATLLHAYKLSPVNE